MKATFGAGCFWHVEEAFRVVKGVKKTTVGYMGGNTKNPTYKQVCSKKTGHVEVCEIKYDSKIVSYERLLEIFWKIHDPTQVGGQGLDFGIQYRSVIFYHTQKQKETAVKSRKKEQAKRENPITTTIEQAKTFYEAEAYHQKYLMKRGRNTC